MMTGRRELEKKAREIRKLSIISISRAGSGHPGGSLSSADVLAALYFGCMNIRPDEPWWKDRDRFVMSKGHGCPALYAALALRGYFPVEELMHLRQLGAMLQGHPCSKKTPGIDVSTGSLGQGLSQANGIALAGRLDKKDFYTYCLMGDGELEEGQVWEAAMTAAHYKLDHVIAFIDYNHLQIDGTIEEVAGNGKIREKFEAFGWRVMEADGHNIDDILQTIYKAKKVQGSPICIILHTVKGKGVSFMEGRYEWHGSVPSKEQTEQALCELEENV